MGGVLSKLLPSLSLPFFLRKKNFIGPEKPKMQWALRLTLRCIASLCGRCHEKAVWMASSCRKESLEDKPSLLLLRSMHMKWKLEWPCTQSRIRGEKRRKNGTNESAFDSSSPAAQERRERKKNPRLRRKGSKKSLLFPPFLSLFHLGPTVVPRSQTQSPCLVPCSTCSALEHVFFYVWNTRFPLSFSVPREARAVFLGLFPLCCCDEKRKRKKRRRTLEPGLGWRVGREGEGRRKVMEFTEGKRVPGLKENNNECGLKILWGGGGRRGRGKEALRGRGKGLGRTERRERRVERNTFRFLPISLQPRSRGGPFFPFSWAGQICVDDIRWTGYVRYFSSYIGTLACAREFSPLGTTFLINSFWGYYLRA